MKKIIFLTTWMAMIAIADCQNQTYTICSGSAITLTANMYPGITNITYSINPGGSVSTSPLFTVMPAATTVYTLYTSGNNGTSNVTYSYMATVNVSGISSYSFSGTQNFVLGCGTKSAVVVKVTGVTTTPQGGAVSFSLMGSMQGGQDYTLTTPGSYTLVLHDNTGGCNTYVPFSVVQNTFAPSLDTIKGKLLLNCFTPTTMLQAVSTSSNVNYSWTFPGPGFSTGDTIKVSALTNAPTGTLVGNYILTLQDQNTECTSKHTVQVKQNLFPPIAKIALTGSLTCASPTVVLSNQSMTGIPPQSGYPTNNPVVASIWEGPGFMPPSPGSTYTASISGVYTLTVIDMNNGCPGKATAVVGENKLVPLINNPVVPPPGNICGSLATATLAPVISTPKTNLSYTWSVPANAITSNLNALILTTNLVGEYTLNVTDNSNGCIASQTMQVVQCVGLSEFNNSGIKLFPNPASDVLYFSSRESEEFEFIVADINSKVVMKRKVSSGEEVSIKELEKGIYFVNLMLEGKVSGRMKIVKR